jgi:D-serine deaminase-like pyridoxal phosphate-dependent protein
MARRARDLGVNLRPHIKTHKCIEIARRQAELGAKGITVSTLDEAEVFSRHGFRDITWAFPIIYSRLEQAVRLAQEVDLGLVVDSHAALSWLDKAEARIKVWLKIDCGQGRAGVDPDSDLSIALASRIHQSPAMVFGGILTHSGQAYDSGAHNTPADVAAHERQVMAELANTLRGHGITVPEVSVGSTPAMSVVDNLEGITEARPGNYVFYDYTQTVLGSCQLEDCALNVLTTVVSSPPGSGRSVIDAGALALSLDPGPRSRCPPGYGLIVDDQGRPKPDLRVVGLSQEHGVVNQELPLGTRLRVLPNHSCLTTACFDEMVVVQEDSAEHLWAIWRGR